MSDQEVPPSDGQGADRGLPTPRQPLLQPGPVVAPLKDPVQRGNLGLSTNDDDLDPLIVELNLGHAEGLPAAKQRFFDLYEVVVSSGAGRREPQVVANTYVSCELSMSEVRLLVGRDQANTGVRQRAIYRIWPDFEVRPLIDASVTTVKADAAQRSFAATGRGISWAVVDTGIDPLHPHFRTYDTLGGDVAQLHKDFGGGEAPLTDSIGHGTHVGGIIAGGLQEQLPENLRITAHIKDEYDVERLQDRPLADGARLAGVAPQCKLVSLKVFDQSGRSRTSNVMMALEYVRRQINADKILRIHGVNLSLGYEFDAKWYAAGQSPLCVEVDRLVRSGVVVVAAAGNTGYGSLNADERQTSTGMVLTINDPGNAELAITVGSTHRDSPYTYGVSYFSSKGPTGDGRLKPDLVAPGERITSCAAGKALEKMHGPTPPVGLPYYIDDSGTSMAAPHVSGAIAAFLSIRREFIGRPEEVKRIFLQSATSLGRERYFQGHGLVDLMRAIQSI